MPRNAKRIRRKRTRSSHPFKSAAGRKRLALLLGAILAGLAVIVLLLTYFPKVYRDWQESRLLKRANAMLQEWNLAEANRTAREVLRTKPDSLPAFYILAESTEKENRAETVAWRAQIARLLPGDLDSQLNLASAALRFGQLDVARRALDSVAAADRDRAAYHVVAGWLARAQGNEEGVEQHFATAVEKEPNNDLYQFNLASLQIRSPDLEKSTRARDALHRLSKVPAFRTGSLRALLSDAIERNDLHAADGFAQELQMSQQVTFADYLLCLEFYQKLDEKKFATLLDKVKPVAARRTSDLALLMDWMNRHGLAAEVLKWMEKLKPEETTHPPAAVAIAEAFAIMKNWSRLRRWTRSSDWGEVEHLRLAYQAYAARQSRASAAEAEFDSLWSSAEYAAADNSERQAALARMAMTWNLTAEAEKLWMKVSKNPPARREALDALLQIYRAKNDLPNLYQTMQRLRESSPNEVGLAADYARLALLIEHNTAEGHRIAREIYEKMPDELNCAVTYAFSLYGLGRTGEGIEILKKFTPEQLRDPHAAVFVAVLLLDQNQSEAAKEFIEAAQKGPIFPEEKKLLEEAQAREDVAPGASLSPSPATSATPTPSRVSLELKINEVRARHAAGDEDSKKKQDGERSLESEAAVLWQSRR